ncbi:MAG TPA: hypothetical protein VNN17_07055, partial [Terriglobia bacterium]|nr:hypothetical protein [Terriglobia bacterium]
NSSRRTHTLALDPRHPETLYAGTTEGLWRTPDGGASWHRLTSHTWIINGILLDPRNPERFLIALDRAGVMETLDGGKSYRSANQGFVQRRISRMIADPADEDRLYISLLHDKEFGGVFTTTARQTTWQQLSAGLQGHDVLSLLIVTQPEWRLLAGTTEGVYEYSPQRPVWKNLGRWAGGAGNHGSGRGPVVRDLFQRAPQERLYAATSAGLFESSDGRDWRRLPLEVADGGLYAVASLGAQGEILLAASSSRLYRSADRGRSWREVPWEGNQPVRIHRIAPHPETPAEAYAATETGLYRSVDGGQSWAKKARGLPHTSFYDVQFVSASPLQILAAGASGAYRSQDGGEWFFRIGSGALSDGLSSGISAMQLIGHSEIVAASLVNGLFLQLPTEYTLPRELPSKE